MAALVVAAGIRAAFDCLLSISAIHEKAPAGEAAHTLSVIKHIATLTFSSDTHHHWHSSLCVTLCPAQGMGKIFQ